MYNLTQATQCAEIWNAYEDDTLSGSDALTLMNGSEPSEETQRKKRNLLLLVAAIIAGAIAAAAGG